MSMEDFGLQLPDPPPVKKPWGGSKCKGCGHTHDAHGSGECAAHVTSAQGRSIPCGCVKFEAFPKREPRNSYLVTAEFSMVKGPERKAQVRVKANGLVGAIANGMREAKKVAVPARKRISGVRVTVVPMGKVGK